MQLLKKGENSKRDLDLCILALILPSSFLSHSAQTQGSLTKVFGPDSDVMSYPPNNPNKVSPPPRTSTSIVFTCISIAQITFKLHQPSASAPD